MLDIKIKRYKFIPDKHPLSDNDKYMALKNAESLFGEDFIKEFNDNDGLLTINDNLQVGWDLENRELDARLTLHVHQSISEPNHLPKTEQ
ncbi:MAG TPA: hypothetical protein PK431_17175 [Chitinophagales bacterium]|nr:hypothetical protein [Chitinophagales bacterium]